MAKATSETKSDRYSSEHGRHFGKFVIISNEDFRDINLSRRTGTEKDVERLQTTFSAFGFDFKDNIHRNKTTWQMLKIISEVARTGLEGYSCLAIAILSHGHEDDSIHGVGANRDVISLESLFEPLKFGMKADGKPKIIFIQACRGHGIDPGKLATDDGETTKRSTNGVTIPVEADFLYHFSTSPGYYSFRNGKGSVFIQKLCETASDYSEKKRKKHINLMKLLIRVNRQVAEGFSSYVPSDKAFHEKKQMPSILSMLRKDIYLTAK